MLQSVLNRDAWEIILDICKCNIKQNLDVLYSVLCEYTKAYWIGEQLHIEKNNKVNKYAVTVKSIHQIAAGKAKTTLRKKITCQ